MEQDPAARKRALRRDALARRSAATGVAGFVDAAGQTLATHGLTFLHTLPGRIVSGFWPMRDEIDPRPLMTGLHESGRILALPVVVAPAMPLIFRAWQPGVSLVPGVFGTSMPGPDYPECLPDIVLVPLLGFSRDGARLGYGGGFYDRTLAKLRRARRVLAIGLAYACQEMEGIPLEAWDEPLDAVLTEAGVMGSGA